MKFKYIWIILFCFFLFPSCAEEPAGENSHEEEAHHEESGLVHFSEAQFEALEMKVGPLPLRNMAALVEANGQLEVPPQNEATVTATLGGNIKSIQVIEGDWVKQGQVLAYLSHPEISELQGEYLAAYNQLQFARDDFERQRTLYGGGVASGKEYQRARMTYEALQSQVAALVAQLSQLGLDPERIRAGDFYMQVPIKSPIEGSVTQVNIKTGQYVIPQADLFEVINLNHIHADIMVFEKDILKVREGQRVKFTVETMEDTEHWATIYSVGRKFEEDPKAVHVHADITNKMPLLLPGMYLTAEIITDEMETHALPEGAVVREGGKYYAFIAEKEQEEGHEGWMFTPIEVIPGETNNQWMEVTLTDAVPKGTVFALNNAYYLMAEMNKGEAGHSH